MSDSDPLIQYLRRSYTAVDGLWFMMVEEDSDFERALAIDEKVWTVMPKIQARRAREVLDATENTVQDLKACFCLKLRAEGHEFHTEDQADGIEFVITRCKWRQLLRKSDRQHLEERISETIWPTELNGWCEEFGAEFDFQFITDVAANEQYRIRFQRC